MNLQKSCLPLYAALAMSFTACLPKKDTANQNTQKSRENRISIPQNKALLRMTANRECQNNDECRVLEFGSRPCGGPSQMLPYSNSQINISELQRAADSFTEEEKKYNQSMNAVGTCEALMPPQVSCLQNLCSILDDGQPIPSQTLIVNFQNENSANDALSRIQDFLPVSSSKKIFSSPPIYSFELRSGVDANHYMSLVQELDGVLSVEIDKKIPQPEI